jgi:hypothetical protein
MARSAYIYLAFREPTPTTRTFLGAFTVKREAVRFLAALSLDALKLYRVHDGGYWPRGIDPSALTPIPLEKP